MPITKAILKQRIKTAYDAESDVEVLPEEARDRVAQEIADAVEAYVVGRQTQVTGTTADGVALTGTGTIN